MNYPRSTHLRETKERAIRYYRESGRRESVAGSVDSACATMLFRPNDDERRQLIEAVRNAPLLKR